MSCGIGDIDRAKGENDPESVVIEDLILAESRGAIALFGPTRGLWSSGVETMSEIAIDELKLNMQNPENRRSLAMVMRDVQRQFKQHYIDYPLLARIADQMVFYGDPLMVLNSPYLIPTSTEERIESGEQGRTSLSVVPNPFRRQVGFVLSGRWAGQDARVRIYDIAGRLVWQGSFPGEGNILKWNGRAECGAPAASGIYFAELVVAGRRSDCVKLVYVK